MKVRATKDGTYAGYYRVGPMDDDQRPFAGEVFEIDDRPFPVVDYEGKPVFELDERGKRIMDKDGKPKMKMATWFSPEWMERVADDTPTTWDYPPFEPPIQYRAKKVGQNQPPRGGVSASSQAPAISI